LPAGIQFKALTIRCRTTVIGFAGREKDKPNNWLAALASRPGNRASVTFSSPATDMSKAGPQVQIWVDAIDDSNAIQAATEYSNEDLSMGATSSPLPRVTAAIRRASLANDTEPLPSNVRRRRRVSANLDDEYDNEGDEVEFLEPTTHLSGDGEQSMEFLSDEEIAVPASLRSQHTTTPAITHRDTHQLPMGRTADTKEVSQTLRFDLVANGEIDIDEEAIRQQFGELEEDEEYDSYDDDAEESAEVARAIAAVAAVEEAERRLKAQRIAIGIGAEHESDDMDMELDDE